MVTDNTPITPAPGFMLTQLHDEKELFSQSSKLQRSIVVAIGAPILDRNGNEKQCPFQLGDTIIHHPTGREVNVEFKKYILVNFDEAYGSYKSK